MGSGMEFQIWLQMRFAECHSKFANPEARCVLVTYDLTKNGRMEQGSGCKTGCNKSGCRWRLKIQRNDPDYMLLG